MGLDMYLEKRTYVKNWDHMKPAEKHIVTVTGPAEKNIKCERISEIVEEAMYWRKANAVHQWFVTNVQNGQDNCGHYYVSTEKLEELASLCERIVKATTLIEGKVKNGSNQDGPIIEDGKIMDYESAKLASELLPTTSGFFFGSTDYNEWYFDDVKETAEKLRALLNEGDGGSYYYHSSW